VAGATASAGPCDACCCGPGRGLAESSARRLHPRAARHSLREVTQSSERRHRADSQPMCSSRARRRAPQLRPAAAPCRAVRREPTPAAAVRAYRDHRCRCKLDDSIACPAQSRQWRCAAHYRIRVARLTARSDNREQLGGVPGPALIVAYLHRCSVRCADSYDVPTMARNTDLTAFSGHASLQRR
jgi:hypothetical protein